MHGYAQPAGYPPPHPGMFYYGGHGVQRPELHYPPPVQPYGPAQPQVPPPHPKPPSKQHPNAEPRPGVFRFQAMVFAGDMKHEFAAETDILWNDFADRAKALLDDTPKPIKLAIKIIGEAGKASLIMDATAFGGVMARLVDKAMHARSKAVSVEVKNLTEAPPPAKGKKKGKRGRDEDIPPPIDANAQEAADVKSYQLLEQALRCELHHGHCFVDRRTGGYETHRRLNFEEMTVWSRKMARGEASIYSPPNCLNFDRGTAKRTRNSVGSQQPPHIHLTINTPPTSYSVDASGQAAAGQGPSFLSSTLFSGPSTAGPSTAGPSTAGPLTIAAELSSGARSSPFILPARTSSITASSTPIDPDVDERRLEAVQALTAVGQGAGVYPPVRLVLDLLNIDYPAANYPELEAALHKIGVDDANQVYAMAIDVLSAIGNMGPERAQQLQTYAGYGVSSVLGLRRPIQDAFRGPYHLPQKVGDSKPIHPNPAFAKFDAQLDAEQKELEEDSTDYNTDSDERNNVVA